MPDYQGIGLGTKFLNVIAKMYQQNGKQFTIVTSAKNMISSLRRSPNWELARYSTNKCMSEKSKIDYPRTSVRTNCKTASFFYKAVN